MAIPAFASVDRNLLRQSIRVGISILITCAIAQHFERITYLFYPLMAVNVVVDDQDENSIRAARGRILGTITGGLVTFLVHSIMTGWIGILAQLPELLQAHLELVSSEHIPGIGAVFNLIQ